MNALNKKSVEDLDVKGKRVLVRCDFNVPLKDGEITNDKRIVAALPTIKYLMEQGAKVILCSHLGRPKGEYKPEFSLAPVAKRLSEYLGVDVPLAEDENVVGDNAKKMAADLQDGQVMLLENVRYRAEETKNEENFSKELASLADLFVNDAFGTAHRAQASTYGVAEFAPVACAGPLLAAELDALGKALKEPARPMVAIVGGSKVSTKLEVLNSLSKIADQIIVGGGIANTFIAAAGHNVGKSLYEADLIPVAKELAASTDIPVPVDVRVGTEFSETAPATEKSVTEVKDDESIFDIGDKSAEQLAEIIKNAKTVLWNGPVGVFEFPNFRKGTEIISHAIADSDAFSIAGGGDTLAAIDLFGIADKISYISTGGGAFLEFVEGKVLPAVEILEKRAKN